MSRKNHNKKRNTGLLYEFLVRRISEALIEGNERKSNVALKVLKKHFKADTQLYKEFRLINSLMVTTVKSEHTAASIIKEAKKAAKTHNNKILDREKSLLIRSINHSINESTFYDQQVNEYKMLATIQTLINDWRNGSTDIERMGKYEDDLMSWLVTEKVDTGDSTLGEENPGMNRLLMKIMFEKLNEKYSDNLTNEQKDVIRTYVWSTANDDTTRIKSKLEEVRGNLLGSLDSFSSENSENEYVVKRLHEAKEKLLNESVDDVNDDTITRFMLYMKLHGELTEDE